MLRVQEEGGSSMGFLCFTQFPHPARSCARRLSVLLTGLEVWRAGMDACRRNSNSLGSSSYSGRPVRGSDECLQQHSLSFREVNLSGRSGRSTDSLDIDA